MDHDKKTDSSWHSVENLSPPSKGAPYLTDPILGQFISEDNSLPA